MTYQYFHVCLLSCVDVNTYSIAQPFLNPYLLHTLSCRQAWYVSTQAKSLQRRATTSTILLEKKILRSLYTANPLALMISHQDKSTTSNNSIASHTAHFLTSHTLTIAASLTLIQSGIALTIMDNQLGIQYICARLLHPTAESPPRLASYHSSTAHFHHASVIRSNAIIINSVLIIQTIQTTVLAPRCFCAFHTIRQTKHGRRCIHSSSFSSQQPTTSLGWQWDASTPVMNECIGVPETPSLPSNIVSTCV